MDNICKYAIDYSGNCFECQGFYDKKIECDKQIKDLNPDGSINIVMCGEDNRFFVKK